MSKGSSFKMGGGKVVWPGFTEVTQRRVAKVGRNEPCPCGSRKKYKDCHEKNGDEFLEKLARLKAAGRSPSAIVPWYKRLFRRG